MFFVKPAAIKLIATITILGGFVACGNEQRSQMVRESLSIARSSGGAGVFNGSWKVKLKGTRDGCGLGLAGKTQPATVVIAHSGRSIKLTITGLPKAFKGTASGSSATASGTYRTSGLTLSGAISASKLSTKKIKISSATLKITGSGKPCTVVFSGSGTRA